MESALRKGLVLLLCAALVASPTVVRGQATAGSASEWRLRYEAGPEQALKGKRVTLRLSPEAIVYEADSGASRRVPLERLREAAYDNVTWHRATSVLGWMGHGGGGGDAMGGQLGLLAVAAIAAAVLTPFPGHDHFLRLAWEENGEEQAVWFELGKQDYQPVLAELERLMGRPVVDMPEARAELRARIEQQEDNRISFRLDRPVWVNGERLSRGRYQVVVLEETESPAWGYFFRGDKVKPDKVVTSTRIEVAPTGRPGNETTHPPEPEVIYSEAPEAVATVREIRATDRTLRFLPAWHLIGAQRFRFDQGRPEVYFREGNDRLAKATYVDFEGEPAVRFRVEHHHFWSPCDGWLYLLRDRVIYEVNPKKDGAHAFRIPRSQVREFSGHELRVRMEGAKEKDYYLRQLSEPGPETGIQPSALSAEQFMALTWEHFDAVEQEFRSALVRRADRLGTQK